VTLKRRSGILAALDQLAYSAPNVLLSVGLAEAGGLAQLARIEPLPAIAQFVQRVVRVSEGDVVVARIAAGSFDRQLLRDEIPLAENAFLNLVLHGSLPLAESYFVPAASLAFRRCRSRAARDNLGLRAAAVGLLAFVSLDQSLNLLPMAGLLWLSIAAAVGTRSFSRVLAPASLLQVSDKNDDARPVE
jgi:hypothetical protein